MELIYLSEEVYNAFASVHPYANFLNSVYSGRKFKAKGWDVEYIGLQEEDKILAATLLVSTPLRSNQYFYAPRGFLIDYQNAKLLETFTNLLLEHMKNKNGLFLKIDPYVAYQQHDLNGDVIIKGFKHDDMIENLTKLNYQHQGFSVGYDDSTQCRWMSTLNLKEKSDEQLLKDMSAQTRRHIQASLKLGVRVRKLPYEQLYILHELVSATSERRGFANMSLEYYQEEYKMFEDHAQAYYSYLDLEAYEIQLNQEKQKEKMNFENVQKALIEHPDSKKHKGRVATSTQQLQAIEKRMEELLVLKKEYDQEVPLAAGLFLFYGEEVIYLTGGSNDAQNRLKGPYAMQWHVIQKAKQEGYSFYNFYGISGYFKEEEDGYGVFDFKRGFKAEVIELLGDFILPINKTKYKVYQTMSSLKKKVKK